MHKLRGEGKSYSEIANFLNEHKIKTRYTREDKISSWYSTTVRNILNRKDVELNDEKKETAVSIENQITSNGKNGQ